MSLQVQSNDLRAMNGFDIQDIAGNRQIQPILRECIEQNNGLFAKSFCISITASFKALFRLTRCFDRPFV